MPSENLVSIITRPLADAIAARLIRAIPEELKDVCGTDLHGELSVVISTALNAIIVKPPEWLVSVFTGEKK
ncbi:hypothetical protein [Fimbriiglobus ruber]|uniref:Uncharacterized protein n=1 Tax=Fimbriiglobus ruber TaxID=1908690 RepID=A0A225DXD6_9BACT|nr:hypothetical protein [Fimbriiglobus ruber]OWK42366.1 hypothetical protein FRUB_04444 [Fimbriiglobus ruber]